jgi:hypothetical protein
LFKDHFRCLQGFIISSFLFLGGGSYLLKAQTLSEENQRTGDYKALSQKKFDSLIKEMEEIPLENYQGDIVGIKEKKFDFFERMVSYCLGKVSLSVFEDLELMEEEETPDREACFEHLKEMHLSFEIKLYHKRLQSLHFDYEKKKKWLSLELKKEEKEVQAFYTKLKGKRRR